MFFVEKAMQPPMQRPKLGGTAPCRTEYGCDRDVTAVSRTKVCAMQFRLSGSTCKEPGVRVCK